MLFLMFLFLLIITLVLSFFYFIPFFYGAPFEKSKEEQINKIIKFSKNSKLVAELGSGNGKIAIKLAKKGIKVDCYEINPFLILLTKRKIKKLFLENNVKIKWKNFFKQDLSKYDTIIFFQFPTITNKLKNKFDRELKKGTKIISNYWPLPNMKPKEEENLIKLYIK